MIITFCGHSNFLSSVEYEEKILRLLEELVRDSHADIYLGGYGEFDNFAYRCCKKFQQHHKNISIVFITPYITLEYQKHHLNVLKDLYDSIIYPQIEDKPLRFAITYRNRWMIEKADFVISYISYKKGGAYATYKYAKSKGKIIFNLGKYQE